MWPAASCFRRQLRLLEVYYEEIAEGFNKDLAAHIHNDTKTIHLDGTNIRFGQVEVWDATPLIAQFEKRFDPHPSEEWLINIASIKENRSYFYTNSSHLREKIQLITLAKEMNRYFQIAQRLWLRKEILPGSLFPPPLNLNLNLNPLLNFKGSGSPGLKNADSSSIFNAEAQRRRDRPEALAQPICSSLCASASLRLCVKNRRGATSLGLRRGLRLRLGLGIGNRPV